VLKRLAASVVTIFAVITLTFFLMRLMPGGPFTGERINAKALANMNEKYGLDKPLIEQYGKYLLNTLKLDFGVSMIMKGRTVSGDIIGKYFPVSAKLGLVVVALALFGGIGLGLLAGVNHGKWPDRLSTVIATLGLTVPSFVIASTLIYFLGVKWGLLRPTGFSGWKDYIMPSVALTGSGLAIVTRLTRSEYVEVKNSDYMRTARAKGLSNFTVITRHGLRNSIIPVATYIGPMIAGVLTGSFVIETMFSIPGLGRDFVTSVSRRDYSVVMGVVLFYCTFVIICNFLVDIVYVVIDPRIRLFKQGGKARG
jgi:oligopeptide transport system permease protein